MEVLFTVNNLWILVATCLVFIMHLGFASLEAGFVQRKNVVNILFKNSMIISIGLLTYYLLGYRLMYPGDDALITNFLGAFGTLDWAGGATADYAAAQQAVTDGVAGALPFTGYADFIFQAMFAATCATIVSGAVAERIKLVPFLLFATLFVAISYPITGMWGWGGGWPRTSASRISPAPHWCTPPAASPPWPPSSSWGRAGVNIARTARSPPYQVTACRWPPSGYSCSGSGGSASMAVRCSVPIPTAFRASSSPLRWPPPAAAWPLFLRPTSCLILRPVHGPQRHPGRLVGITAGADV